MPSTYSQLLRIELQAVGENETTWGDVTNTNLSTVLEQAIAGKADIVLSDANHTLTTRFGEEDEARKAMIFVTGACTAVRSLIVPRLSKHYIVRNNTTGGHELEVKTDTGNGVRIANGKAKLVFCDGVNVQDATVGSVDAGTVSPSSLSSDSASWSFKGFVGVNRSNAVDNNYGVLAADGPVGSYLATYANGQLVGQLTALTNDLILNAPSVPLRLRTGNVNRVTITTGGDTQVHGLLDARADLNVIGTAYGTYADFSGEVEAGSFRVEGSGPTIYMQETNDGSYTRTLHMNVANVGITSTIGGWTFYSQNNGNAWIGGSLTQNSDERKKTNWAGMPDDFVERMAGVKCGTYDRIDESMRQVGVSAQELEKVLPEAVSVDHDGYKCVAYGDAALVLAIELAKTVQTLKQEIVELKARVSALEQS